MKLTIMKIWIALLIVLLVNPVNAATIKGTVYNEDLSIQKNSIVEINTSPSQKIIAREGTYSFEVAIGEYTLKAKYLKNNEIFSSFEEKISIKDNGIYNLDLILFPIPTEPISENEVITDNSQNNKKTIFIAFILLILLGATIFLIFKNKSLKDKSKKIEKTEDLEDDLKKVINIIKSHGNRTTQKEIRKELGLSEAKTSLMIADLESQNKIRKIKKGRGNIIILSSQ